MTSFPTLLPRLDENDVRLLCEVDRYDGPISGILEHQEQTLFWFDWCHDGDGEESESAVLDRLGCTGRLFLLHPVPDAAQARAWVREHRALADEYRLVANPHAWPVSEWQRRQLRPLPEIRDDWARHAQARPLWEDQPATAWLAGMPAGFAAFQTFRVSREEGQRLEQWQRDVARALYMQDQAKLDHLFKQASPHTDDMDLYLVRLDTSASEAAMVMRDWRGQPLPATFWMTASHRVQDLTGLVDSN